MSDGAVIATFIATIFAVLGVIGLGIRYGSHHYDAARCHSFGEQSGREVKFVDYTFWSWGCLTPAQDGKWIDVSLLRDVAP